MRPTLLTRAAALPAAFAPVDRAQYSVTGNPSLVLLPGSQEIAAGRHEDATAAGFRRSA